MKTVAFGVGGKALMRGVWELLGWQMLEGLSLSACHSQQCAHQCCDPRPAFSDPPCLGCKSVEAGTVSQALSRLGECWVSPVCSAWEISWCPVPVHPAHRELAWTFVLDKKDLYFHVPFAQQKCLWGPIAHYCCVGQPLALPSSGGG